MSIDSAPAPDADRVKRRNLVVLFVVSTLIGLGGAVYEVALPLFLKDAHLSWRTMGWIYGAGAVVTFVVRIWFGAWSDRIGRKAVYVGSLFVAGAATLVTPVSSGAWVQGALKSVTDPAGRLRDAMHSVLLFESWPKRFQKIFSKTRGVEFMCHFVGLLLAAALLGVMVKAGVSSPTGWFIAGAALLLLLSGAIFALFFREPPLPSQGKPSISWRDLLRMDMTGPMWVMAISGFIFSLGVTTSHCFALQLFFQEKYGASDSAIFIIGALHRLSSAITLLFLGHAFTKHLRMWFMLFLVLEGIFLAAPSFMPAAGEYHVAGLVLPALWTVVVVWLAHDFMGMGLWLPIQQVLIQRHSRTESRGEDVVLVTAIGALGSVPAPFLAGALREMSVGPVAERMPFLAGINLPFLVSGVGVALSAVVLLWLPKEGQSEA